MRVDESVDTGFAEFSDEFVDFGEVEVVILAFGSFDSFPHHTETDMVETPSFEIFDVLIIEGKLWLKCALGWNVRIDFVNNIDSVEDNSASRLISKHAGGGINSYSC